MGHLCHWGGGSPVNCNDQMSWQFEFYFVLVTTTFIYDTKIKRYQKDHSEKSPFLTLSTFFQRQVVLPVSHVSPRDICSHTSRSVYIFSL